MKRTDVEAGVIYAVKNSYGPPGIVVFLEDGAAGLYQRERHGAGIRQLIENKTTKAKRGQGWSETTRGYAAIEGRWDANKSEVLDLLAAIDPATELERFKANEQPSVDGLSFEIRYTLTDVSGLYADEKAAYDEAKEAERAADRHRAEQKAAAAERAGDLLESLSAYGIRLVRATDEGFFLKLGEADKLLALLREYAPSPEA